MKDVLVLIASIILGVVLASMVIGLKEPAKKLTNYGTTQIESIMTISTKAGIN